MPERLLYRIAEAAEALGVSRSVIYDLIRSGAIRAIRVRSDLRVPVADLRAWIAAQPPDRLPGRSSPRSHRARKRR